MAAFVCCSLSLFLSVISVIHLGSLCLICDENASIRAQTLVHVGRAPSLERSSSSGGGPREGGTDNDDDDDDSGDGGGGTRGASLRIIQFNVDHGGQERKQKILKYGFGMKMQTLLASVRQRMAA